MNAAPGADLGALQHTVRRLVARVHDGTADCSEVRAVLHGVHLSLPSALPHKQPSSLIACRNSCEPAVTVYWRPRSSSTLCGSGSDLCDASGTYVMLHLHRTGSGRCGRQASRLRKS